MEATLDTEKKRAALVNSCRVPVMCDLLLQTVCPLNFVHNVDLLRYHWDETSSFKVLLAKIYNWSTGATRGGRSHATQMLAHSRLRPSEDGAGRDNQSGKTTSIQVQYCRNLSLYLFAPVTWMENTSKYNCRGSA